MPATKQEIKNAFSMVAAVAETIREAGKVPSGTIYAAIMGRVDFAGYQRIISILKNAQLIEEKGRELIWIGPMKGERLATAPAS